MEGKLYVRASETKLSDYFNQTWEEEQKGREEK